LTVGSRPAAQSFQAGSDKLRYPRAGQLSLRQRHLLVMASFRKENFFARVMELNLDECIPTLKAKGFTTYATFAFGSD
jgi:hypothetical protein